MTKPRLEPPSPWMEASWIVAGLGLISGFVGSVLAFSFGVAAFRIGIYVSTALCIGWLLTLLAALAGHGWRGLWLLVVSPIALFWPGIFGLFMYVFRNG